MPSSISRLSLVGLIIIEGHHALLQPIHQHPPPAALSRHIISRRTHQSSSTSSALFASSPPEELPRRVKIRARAVSKGSSGGGQASATLTRPKKRKSKVATAKKSTAKKSTIKNNAKIESPKEDTVEPEEEEEPVHQLRKPTIHTKSGAPFQHQEMMDHILLTKEEEILYGRRVVRARELREQIENLLEERRVESEMRKLEMEELELGLMNDGEVVEGGDIDYDFLSYELEYLSVYGYRPKGGPEGNDLASNNNNNNSLGGFDLEDDLLINHAQHRSHHMSQLQNDPSIQNFVGKGSSGPKRNGYRNSSSSSTTSAANRNSYTPLLQIQLHKLSEEDVIQILDIPGGKHELVNIFLDGAHAREILMRRNVKLVMSIAKNWMRNSFSTANANLGGGGGGGGTHSGGGKDGKKYDKSTKAYLAQMYEGSWDRPSLDEAAQEGMLGLARAVDKYDPERGLRFSTYATHWITSYVRTCFQRAVTGCLRVPSQLHDIKAAYNKILKDHLHLGNTPPGQESIAKELGISEKRLVTAIRATGSLLSVDAPVVGGNGGSYKGSMAGGDGANGQELLILDTLKCAEPKPEDQVEISFLRQCLENAMATELTPYERDVLRLRLGLDSGEGKTVREIVEISGGSVSMSDVRSAERRAFKKLRSPTSVHTHNLLAYLDFAGVGDEDVVRSGGRKR